MNSIIISLIVSMSPHFGIKPETAIAVAKVESSLNAEAIGSFGEVGLFQIRPEYSKYTAEELKNPAINVLEGLRILSEAKSRCKHQEGKTWLNCYNLGITGGARIKHPKLYPYYLKVMNRLADAN